MLPGRGCGDGSDHGATPLTDIEVVNGVAPRLDQLARETAQNTWSFLPAIAKGKVADISLTFNVVFRRGAPERPRR